MYVLGEIKDEPIEEEYKYQNNANFWSKMAVINNIASALKYPKFNEPALDCLLVLPHGNSHLERDFSINKKYS